MNLIYRITLRISATLLVVFAVWGILFYIVIIDEINDETDDSLEDYAEYIITRALAGEALPDADNGTNNSYYINEVDELYAKTNPSVRYLDEEVYLYSKKETEPARIFKTIFKNKDNLYFELTVMIPTIEKSDLERTILLWIIILYFGLLLTILAINAIVLRQSLRPLYVLLDWLDELSLERELKPLDLNTNITEFKKLSDSLYRSAERNAEIYEQQSLFIGHASHELQTPIAVAKNRLELLIDEPGLTEDQLKQLIKTKRSLEDIAKLNKTLLLLTRIENRQFEENSNLDINAMFRSLGEDFTEAYERMEIDFTVDERSKLFVRMNHMLASVLISNLIKNAFIHNNKGGKVAVTVQDDGFTVSNTAVSGALNPEYIFRRFYQADKKEGSAGLGLSLVESITNLYKINVTYSFNQGFHTFYVKFPNSIIIKT